MRVFVLFESASLFFKKYFSEGRKEGVYHILFESWPRLEGVVSPFFSGELMGRRQRKLVLVRAFHLLVCRTSTGDGCSALVTVVCLSLSHESPLKSQKEKNG